MRSRFASLTARLVVTAVLLVAVVCVLIATVTTVALHASLNDRLDQEVLSSAGRAGSPDGDHDPGPGGPADGGQAPSLDQFTRNQGPGTLIAFLDASPPTGCVVAQERQGCRTLSTAALDVLAAVPTDRSVHGVGLPAFGSYRVTVEPGPGGSRLVSGLPTRSLDDTVGSLVLYEVLLTLLGTVVAAGVGLLVVRRQLRPLRQVADTAHVVAALPLASGEVDLGERVPDHLTDERTEVGQVGAALNTLLAQVETALDERQRSEQQVRQFVADASHELRTPLATIAGYAELARRRPEDPSAALMALTKVEEESARMTSLVEDLLLLARLDAGRPLQREPVDLTRLLLEGVSDARVLGPEHTWRLVLPDHLDDLREVVGDEQRLHQVVTNLLTNARKHTPAGTVVTVTSRPEGFVVADDGPGFPAELVDHAFERFARGDVSRHRDGGAGLGLSLVEAIVGSHGGTVKLTSVPGATEVVVRLPVPGPTRAPSPVLEDSAR